MRADRTGVEPFSPSTLLTQKPSLLEAILKFPVSLACAVLASTMWAVPTHAQSYPNGAVRVILPFPPGGGLDIVMRPVNEKLTAAKWQEAVKKVGITAAQH